MVYFYLYFLIGIAFYLAVKEGFEDYMEEDFKSMTGIEEDVTKWCMKYILPSFIIMAWPFIILRTIFK